MAVKIRLKRMGATHAPQYRIVVIDSRKKRDGRAIEEIGFYHPLEAPSRIEVDHDRAQYWLGVGAQATGQVLAILKLTGDWQKFKGQKDAQNLVEVAGAKPEFVAPEKDTVVREAITQKRAKKTGETETAEKEKAG